MSPPDGPVSYPRQPVITGVEPQVFVTDMARALDFYQARLGFRIGFTYGDPPFYAQVVRDCALLNLRHVDRPAIDRTAGPALLSAAFSVSSAGLLLEDFRSRGAPILQPLTREPWHPPGHGNFCIADPDGNLLLFGGLVD